MIKGERQFAGTTGALLKVAQRADDAGTCRMRTSDQRLFDCNDCLAHVFRILSDNSVARIIHTLRHREMTISAIARELAMKPAILLRRVLSLHREVLLSARRRSGAIFYSLAIPDLIEALDLVYAIAARQLQRKGTMSLPGRRQSIHSCPSRRTRLPPAVRSFASSARAVTP